MDQLDFGLSFSCREEISAEAIPGLYSTLDCLGRPVLLEEVKASDGFFCSFRRNHYVKPPIRKDGSENTGWPGRNLCFLIKNDGKYVGAIAGGSPPLDMKPVQDFFGLSSSNKLRGYQGRFIFGNVLYRLEKNRIQNPDKNLGTMVLRLWRLETQRIHLQRWKDELAGFVTLIEPSDCREQSQGAMYKADNWQLVGTTKGNARVLSGDFGTDAIERKMVSQKLILCRWAKKEKHGRRIIPQELPSMTDEAFLFEFL